VVCGDAETDSGSLQARFEAMRKRRFGAQSRVKAAAAAKAAGGRTGEAKAALRQKFVAQVRSYLGTPYSASRNPIGEGEAAPLYLDCCGLVRRALIDLKEEFGFEIGPYAQEYLFDTLPKAVEPHELCPGDLVFWEAEYDDPNRKRHKHDMVHVEVFVGGGSRPAAGGAGEGTIGSRYENVEVAGVGEFDSYRSFGGHGAHGHRMHFRSIDTWLDGVCVSHCESCSWGELKATAGFRAGAKSRLFTQSEA
jgi:cell wall-associated NlpC family hydrolase